MDDKVNIDAGGAKLGTKEPTTRSCFDLLRSGLQREWGVGVPAKVWKSARCF